MRRAFLMAAGLAAIASLGARASAQGEMPAGEAEAYYSEAQAARGKALWDTHCGACHSAIAAPVPPGTPIKGFRAGGRTIPSNLGATYILNKRLEGRHLFQTVYHLYRDLESMPSVTDSISPQVRTDILAFMLQANGFPAGRSELKVDPRAMKLMPLDEPGFERIFNGRDFSGWRFLMGLGCTPAPRGCGKSDPGSFITVKEGVVHASRTHGLMYTERKYTNFTLRLDFLAEKPADYDTEDVFYYANSGIMFVTDENLEIWPKSVVFAGELREILKPVPLSALVKPTYDTAARDKVRRPLGEWNSIEIVSKDRTMKGYLNGALITTIGQHEFTEPLRLALQLQGAPVRWRNIRIRPE